MEFQQKDIQNKKSLEAGGDLLTLIDLDSHICPCQDVPGQLFLDDVSRANGTQKLIIASVTLLISRGGRKALQHDDVLIILRMLLTMLTNYANYLY